MTRRISPERQRRETLDATCVNNEVKLQSKIIHEDFNREGCELTVFEETLVFCPQL